MADQPAAAAQIAASIIAQGWIDQYQPQLRQRRVRNEAAVTSTDVVVVPADGLVYADAITLAGKATIGGTWRARFEYASSADAFATWSGIGFGSTVASGAQSLLAWDLGGLDASLTYKIRFQIYDASGAGGAFVTQLGTWQADHTAPPTLTSPADLTIVSTAAAQSFAWTFIDPDAGHAQTSYALRRTRQADGEIRWWRASDSTWQAIETFNPTATQSVNIPAGAWQADGPYAWTVATQDTLLKSSLYSAARSVEFSAPSAAAIVLPIAAGNLVTQGVTMTWTASEQAKYRARLLTGGGFTTVLQDTGIVASASARSVALAGAANGTTVRFELTVYSEKGLATVVTRDKPVVYTGPTTPTAIGTGLANPPRASIAITNPGGGDPFASNSILRSDDGGVSYAVIATGITVSATYVDHHVGAGLTYSYKVRAYGTGDTFTDSAVI